MADMDDRDDEMMTPEGMAEYAGALITVQRKEHSPLMKEIKAKQVYYSCDDDEKELFEQIVSGYVFSIDDCLPEIDDCYMQLSIKKGETGAGYAMSCFFCREKQGKIHWFSISPADYFMIIQIVGIYKPSVVHSYEPYYFFKDDIVEIVDRLVASQMQAQGGRKKIKIIK